MNKSSTIVVTLKFPSVDTATVLSIMDDTKSVVTDLLEEYYRFIKDFTIEVKEQGDK